MHNSREVRTVFERAQQVQADIADNRSILFNFFKSTSVTRPTLSGRYT